MPPPGPEQRIQTIRKAARLCRDTPGRTGRLVRLQDVDDVFVVGDLHGNLENFRQVLLRANLADNPRRHLVLQEVVHGPHRYPNGGDKSHQALELVAALKCQFPRQFHFLLGNHELAQATGRRVGKNDQDLNQLFHLGVEQAYGEHADQVYAAYEELLAATPVALRAPNRVFYSHSLPSYGHLPEFTLQALEREPTLDADLYPGGPIYSLVWGRDVRPETLQGFLAKVDADFLVSGHIPCEQGYDRPSPRHLILDSLGSPAGYAVVPADRSLETEEFGNLVATL